MTTETTIQNKELLLQNNIEGKCDRFDPDVDPAELEDAIAEELTNEP